jgi:hypothetical protein
MRALFTFLTVCVLFLHADCVRLRLRECREARAHLKARAEAAEAGRDRGPNTEVISMQGGVLHPSSGMRTGWDILLGLLVVFTTLVVPYRIGFKQVRPAPTVSPLTTPSHPPTRSREGRVSWLFGHAANSVVACGSYVTTRVSLCTVCTGLCQNATGVMAYFELAVDLLFLLDIVANFLTGFHDESGLYVNSKVSIAKRYLKGWFSLDLISSVPLDFILELVSAADCRAQHVLRAVQSLLVAACAAVKGMLHCL